jgi:hypothetical protein
MFEYSRHPQWDPETQLELTFQDLPHRIDLLEFEHTADDPQLKAQLRAILQWCTLNCGPESRKIDDGNRWCYMLNGLHFRDQRDAMFCKLSCGGLCVPV